MGSIISLGIGHLEIDWGKNNYFRNHSQLFLPDDITDTTYFYAENHTATEPAYVRSLRSVKKRLELLGYTREECRRRYDNAIAEVPDYYPEPGISFDVLARAIANVDVQKIRLPDDPEHYDFGEYVTKNILSDHEFTKSDEHLASLTNYDGHFFENLDPYIILRLLAENPNNLDYDVTWRFNDVVEGGWVEQTELYVGLSKSDQILVVTEGSSDSKIIKKALEIWHSDVADFFKFVDMTDNYPFTGAGNVLRFCQGLCRIGILNRVIVVLDNDTEGRSTCEKIRRLDLPDRMSVTILPDLEDAKAINTLGPTGSSTENINGKAVSIELFLDLNAVGKGAATVRWTSYDKSTKSYQGELVSKEDYTRDFFARADSDPCYDNSRICNLLEHLFSVASNT